MANADEVAAAPNSQEELAHTASLQVMNPINADLVGAAVYNHDGEIYPLDETQAFRQLGNYSSEDVSDTLTAQITENFKTTVVVQTEDAKQISLTAKEPLLSQAAGSSDNVTVMTMDVSTRSVKRKTSPVADPVELQSSRGAPTAYDTPQKAALKAEIEFKDTSIAALREALQHVKTRI